MKAELQRTIVDVGLVTAWPPCRSVLSRRLAVNLSTSLHEPPVDERVVNERFKHSDDRLLVLAQDSHRVLAGNLERALDPRHFHRRGEHPGETEGHLLGMFL